MNTNIDKLEKIVKEQAKQIVALKKAITVLSIQLKKVSTKTERSYITGKKNTSEINSITTMIRGNM